LFQLTVERAFHAGNDITINVRINSFFKKINRGNEYLVKIESINNEPIPFLIQPNIKLIGSTESIFKLGERWQVKVKLKPVLGRVNEAGFDQERYFISQRWYAKAYLSEFQPSKRLEKSDSLRLKIYEKINEQLKGLPNRAILLALSFGDRNGLTPETWQQLKSSGLIHLIAISGLHIGIAYLFGWKFGHLIRLVLTKWFSAPLVFALICAISYAWLAGFSIPTLRALLMCALLGFFTYLRIHYSAWQILLLSLSILLLIDPFSLLSSSFWLSFIAVASIYILLAFKYVSSANWIIRIIIMQIALTVIMLPVTSFYFSGFSLASCLYNFVFVPLFSVVIIPLLFIVLVLSMIIPTMTPPLWWFLDTLLSFVTWSIKWANDSWVYVGQSSMVLISVVVIFFAIQPLLHKQLRLITSITILLTTYSTSMIPKSSWQLTMLDVGHGLSLLIQKNSQYILYDTGNRWEGGSMAQMVIAPIFRYRGINVLDGLILSHLDLDHAGGRQYIEETFSPRNKFSSQKMKGYLPCVDQNNWQWNGLTLSVIWPPQLVERAFNPHSCVIRITDGISSVLLTGDIEAVSELLLVQKQEQLRADILIVPHHGSKTSSTNSFLDAVNPKVALASVSKGNRWNLPHQKVLKRYSDRGVTWLDTGENGQILINFSQSGWEIITQRSRQSLRWYRQKLRKGVE